MNDTEIEREHYVLVHVVSQLLGTNLVEWWGTKREYAQRRPPGEFVFLRFAFILFVSLLFFVLRTVGIFLSCFVSLLYLQLVYLGCWRSEYRKTSHIYIETPRVLVDPRRRYNMCYICRGGPTWISSAFCSKAGYYAFICD